MGIHHDIEFMKLRKNLRKAKNIYEKISMLEEISNLNPRDSRNLALRRKYREELKSLKVKRRQKKRQVQSFYDGIDYKRQVILVGATNTGKSTSLSQLTGSKPTISATSFTTYKPEVGMMNYKDIPIQVIEISPLYIGDSDINKYRFIRNSNVLCVCIRTREDFDLVVRQLKNHLILLTRMPFSSSKEHRYRPLDQVVEKPALVASWTDIKGIDLTVVDISDTKSIVEQMYLLLNIKRIYCIKNGRIEGQPLVFPANQEVTTGHFIERLGKRFLQKFNRARITGVSAKYEGQIVGLEHALHDGDKVELMK